MKKKPDEKKVKQFISTVVKMLKDGNDEETISSLLGTSTTSIQAISYLFSKKFPQVIH